MGVFVGPGRGSAAGSAVAYCLNITDIDPIKYDLLFERFLNPDRISMPDIDIDFDDDGRAEVLRWVTEKYGYEKVPTSLLMERWQRRVALRMLLEFMVLIFLQVIVQLSQFQIRLKE